MYGWYRPMFAGIPDTSPEVRGQRTNDHALRATRTAQGRRWPARREGKESPTRRRPPARSEVSRDTAAPRQHPRGGPRGAGAAAGLGQRRDQRVPADVALGRVHARKTVIVLVSDDMLTIELDDGIRTVPRTTTDPVHQ